MDNWIFFLLINYLLFIIIYFLLFINYLLLIVLNSNDSFIIIIIHPFINHDIPFHQI